MIPQVLKDLDEKGLIEDSDGARVIFVEGVDIPLIAVKKDGGYNYFSTDLASLWLVFTISCSYNFFKLLAYLGDQTLLSIVKCIYL